jgi:hypothetical protein
MRAHARWLGVLAGATIVMACSGGSTAAPTLTGSPTLSQPPAASPSPSTVALPSASLPPTSASISFGGAITGMASGIQVDCYSPSLAGLVIELFGATTNKDIYTTIRLSPSSVAVTIDSGSGTTFSGRNFTGTGVTGFDATKGAQIDSPLAEVVSADKPGSLPALSSIKGTVDCGNQRPGSSTLAVSGATLDGPLSGPIDPIRVDCNPNATPARVHAVGLMKLGSTQVIVVFQATAAGFTLFVPPGATTKQHFFMTSDPTTATISPTGAHVAGSAPESGTANKVQVSGDLVCGVVNP